MLCIHPNKQYRSLQARKTVNNKGNCYRRTNNKRHLGRDHSHSTDSSKKILFPYRRSRKRGMINTGTSMVRGGREKRRGW
jgi:hypothetical protein